MNASPSPSKNTIGSSKYREVDVASAPGNLDLGSHWQLITTTRLVSSEGCYVFSVTDEFSARELPMSLSEQQRTSLIHLLEEHWGEMLSRLVVGSVRANLGSGVDD